MLGSKNALATIAVKDIEVAKQFYEGKLRLEPVPTGESGVLSYRSGSSTILVYVSQFAGTNTATAATWIVGDDVERIVETLKSRGVTFEHYDMPETARVGDVHVSGKVKVAWCKDPDGNILSIVNG